jgi:hypothetical protein
MQEYYYKSGYDLSWVDVTRSSIARYEAGLRKCFRQAIEAGETLEYGGGGARGKERGEGVKAAGGRHGKTRHKQGGRCV